MLLCIAIVYAVSTICTKLITRWYINNDAEFVKMLEESNRMPYATWLPFVPIANTILALAWLKDFIQRGCDLEKMKLK